MDSPASVSKPMPFKSKKKLSSKPSDPSPPASKTPQKHSSSLPTRARQRGVALSISSIRKAAENLLESNHKPQTDSPKKQIFSCDSPVKRTMKSILKLPEKYEMLAEFFDSLDSSIRLLKLKGSMPTFSNVCPKIEALTDRRFTYRHLSQLKFILPEALEFKRVLTLDEHTSSMKPTLHITLNADAVVKGGSSKAETANMNMRRVFRLRLLDFINAHPEGDEVPVGPLPESFNHSQHDFYSDILLRTKLSLPAEGSTEETIPLPLAKASHLPHNFQRRFFHRVTCGESGNSRQIPTEMSIQSSAFPPKEHNEDEISSEDEPNSSSPSTQNGIASETSERHVVQSVAMEYSQYCCPTSTPDREKSFVKSGDNDLAKDVSIDTTPAKLISTPTRLMAATPALCTPKRCYMSPEDNSTDTPNKLVWRPSRMRSLKFDTPVKNGNDEAERDSHVTSHNGDACDVLSESFIQSIRAKEKKATEERDPAISEAKKRQQTIAALPKLFDMIHFLFKSSKLSIITKEELVYKVITSLLDIVDRREVEDQVNMMLELVPEWISERVASTGDLLLCINKMPDPQTIRSKLADAK